MNGVTETLIANVAMACALACVAWLLTRTRKRPALAHLLWLLVLVRLVAPPLLPIAVIPLPEVTKTQPTVQPGIVLSTTETVVDAPATTASHPVARPQNEAMSSALSTRDALFGIWGAGSALLLLLALRRSLRFTRELRRARPAPDHVLANAKVLASRLGLRRCPPVLVVDAAVPPLVWGFLCRPRVVLPSRLLRNVDEEEITGLLAHELAHIRRRDHWTRYLELLVTAAWWWLPLTWWARRRLREAEEACCDAWAVWCAPDAREAYASALIRTITWLDRTRTRAPAPAVGMSAVLSTKRRLGMILETGGKAPLLKRRLLLLCAVLPLITLLPAPAQERPKKRTPARPTVEHYEVGGLCKKNEVKGSQLVEMLRNNVAVRTWKRDDCTIAHKSGTLIVRAPKRVQRHVARFLKDLRAFTDSSHASDDDAPTVSNTLRFIVMDRKGRPVSGVSASYEVGPDDRPKKRTVLKGEFRFKRRIAPVSNVQGSLEITGLPLGGRCFVSFRRNDKVVGNLQIELPKKPSVIESRVVVEERKRDVLVPDRAPLVAGKVVGTKDELVVVNFGKDRAKRGQTFDIIRGNRYIGRITLTELGEKHCAGRLKLIAEGQKVQVGDTVTNELDR